MEGLAHYPKPPGGLEATCPTLIEPTLNRVSGPPGASAPPRWKLLVEPSHVFSHPREVVAAADLSGEEKRAILASWASDAWAVESAPALRECPGLTGRYVPLDEVLEALQALDPKPQAKELAASGSRSRRFCRVRWLTPHGLRSGLGGVARLRFLEKNLGAGSHEPA